MVPAYVKIYNSSPIELKMVRSDQFNILQWWNATSLEIREAKYFNELKSRTRKNGPSTLGGILRVASDQ